ncbi:MAG: ATP-binding protein [Pseudomonadota bacterium]
MNNNTLLKNRLLFASLVAMVLGIGALHALTPGHFFFYHDTYRRLSYFPITVGAIWFGLRGGVFLSILTSAAFIPHLVMFWAYGPEAYYSELTEIFFYLSAGIVVGIISQREAGLRRKYKVLSEQLKASYDRLHNQTRQLVEAEELLGQSQKLSALGQMSASLAHEIKNPLASIRGTAEILMDDFPEGHPKHEFMTIMMTEISRLNTSVQDILQYSRGGQVQNRVTPEPTALVLRRVSSLLEGQIRDKSIRLDMVADHDADACMSDGPKLSQVIMNILINAVEATPQGGHITIDYGIAADGQQIRICDSGPGIRTQDMETIFKPFVTFKPNGTGLGLHISRTIMATMGGAIEVSNAPSGGACFTLLLPETPKAP